MNKNHSYDQLLDHISKTIALGQVSGVLSWDQETMMPKKGAEARAEQMAVMASVIHNRNTDPRIEEWCSDIDLAGLSDVEKANVREARRTYERATKIPEQLAGELARSSALGQGIWAQAKANEDVDAFLPTLEKLVKLKQEEAKCLLDDGDNLYDGLLDEFEPGMNTSDLVSMFELLRPELTQLRQNIADQNRAQKQVSGEFDEQQQMEMARRLTEIFNYDWDGGRLDKSVHPFSSGYRSDARITTRVDTHNVFDCMYSTIHETGHANYEQGRDASMDRTPAGGYSSMGIHESQSRMLENQIGRSRAFMDWLYPQMREVFGDFGLQDADELFDAVNQVSSGYIRTEADEIHYNLHVLLRFDLERALISGDLSVADLEAAWNDRFKADFGMEVDKPSNGLLQDVHWSIGAFGYFPTYSLGNIYAGELFAVMGEKIEDMDGLMSRGELKPISDWLTQNIHQKGNVYEAPDLMQQVCGRKPGMDALVGYLKSKYLH